jgi:hypothetical protein
VVVMEALNSSWVAKRVAAEDDERHRHRYDASKRAATLDSGLPQDEGKEEDGGEAAVDVRLITKVKSKKNLQNPTTTNNNNDSSSNTNCFNPSAVNFKRMTTSPSIRKAILAVRQSEKGRNYNCSSIDQRNLQLTEAKSEETSRRRTRGVVGGCLFLGLVVGGRNFRARWRNEEPPPFFDERQWKRLHRNHCSDRRRWGRGESSVVSSLLLLSGLLLN